MPVAAPDNGELDDVIGSQADDRSSILVLTAPRGGASAGLSLPFTRARVMPIDPAPAPFPPEAEVVSTERFDTVVIDGLADDPVRRNAVVRWAAAQVEPTGRVVVVMPPAWRADAGDPVGQPRHDGDAENTVHGAEVHEDAVHGLVWRGVGQLAGRPCAVLSPRNAAEAGDAADPGVSGPAGGGVAVDVGLLLATMADTARAYASASRTVPTSSAPDHPGQAARGGRSRTDDEARYDSEAALLAHLRTLARDLAAERARRTKAERRYQALEEKHQLLERQHKRLRSSKLGAATLRYWTLRKRLRQRLNGG